MSTPDTPRTPSTDRDATHVPEPASGVRGADEVQGMDPEPGEGTGADGDTAGLPDAPRD